MFDIYCEQPKGINIQVEITFLAEADGSLQAEPLGKKGEKKKKTTWMREKK